MDGKASDKRHHEHAETGVSELHSVLLTDGLYKQLRLQAERHLQRRFGRSAAGLTWQPTALLNETVLRLIKRRRHYDSQGHFFAMATTAMKHVLVDYARKRAAQKRGNDRCRTTFDPEIHSPMPHRDDSPYDIEEVLAAIDRLTSSLPRKGEVAWMRLVWGLTIGEIAESLEISRASVDRDWRFAQAWLTQELAQNPNERP